MTDYIDPNCFEEGAVTFTSSYSSHNSLDDNILNNTDSRKRSLHTKEMGDGQALSSIKAYEDEGIPINSTSSDDVQAYLDAPINAAVNVALKCATREASFEEVLSWLIDASSHQTGFEYFPPPDRDTYVANGLLYPTQAMMASSVYQVS